MRKYKIYYYAEYKDECHDFEYDVEAKDIHHAQTLFQTNIRVFKRIYKIEELPNK